VDGKSRQKVVAYLGRLDEVQREGAIDSLVEGPARYAKRAQVTVVAEDLFYKSAKEYELGSVFKRLWEELGLGEFLARKVRSGAGLSSPVARIPIGRMIVVSDLGTVSEENLELFSELGLSYIVGVRAFSQGGSPGV